MAKKIGKIKSTLIRWLGLPTYYDISYGGSLSGQSVTLDKSLQISAVWACVRLLSETISTLPLKVYEKKNDGSRAEASKKDVYSVLCVEPNKIQTPSKMIEFLVASMSMTGNAFFEKKMLGERLIALLPIQPSAVTCIDQLDSGKYQYTINQNGKQRILMEDAIWHVRGFGLDGILGLSAIEKGKNVIGAAMASSESSSNFFKSGMSASGFVKYDMVLNKEQRDLYRESLEKFTGSKNSGKVMILEKGMDYQGISIDPAAAQLLETRGYDVEEICRLFKVPPTLIGYMSKQSSWASSLEALNQQFLTYTLLPILRNIEQSITKSLINPRDRGTFYAEFNYEGFLRADVSKRAAYYATMLDHGAMNRDEVRKKENLPPMSEGGDIFTVQAALIPIEQVGKNYDKAN